MNRILGWILAAVFACAIAWQALPALAQTEFPVQCEGGVCRMREADLAQLQRIINALVDRILDLQSKTGCS